nr:late embryogenesis abundant protein, LEA-14 [Tanacetum cinerariifolium]
VSAALSIAADVSVFAISTTTADVFAAPTLPAELPIPTSGSVGVPPVTPDLAAISAHADTEVHADESRSDDNQTPSKQVSAEHTVDVSTTVAFTSGVSHATPSSSRRHRKQIAKKRVTPIVDVDDVDFIKFDSASESNGDPSPYVPYVGWEMVTQNWMVITFHVPFWNENWLVQGGTTLELASPDQTATGKDVSNPFMAVMVCQKPLAYFSSPMIHVPRAGLVIHPPG